MMESAAASGEEDLAKEVSGQASPPRKHDLAKTAPSRDHSNASAGEPSSRAGPSLPSDVSAFLLQLQKERDYSPHTILAYQRDRERKRSGQQVNLEACATARRVWLRSFGARAAHGSRSG